MPQASDDLRDEFEDDSAAWAVLQSNYKDERGVIRMRDANRVPTHKELRAIMYLCDEWDYGWSSK